MVPLAAKNTPLGTYQTAIVVTPSTGHGETVMTQTLQQTQTVQHRPIRPTAVGHGPPRRRPARRGRALLERDGALQTLAAAVRAAAAGHGSAVLVTGEAGIGKTTLVREFVERTGGRVKVLGGGCDNLVTPRPLGPLRDAAAGTGGKLEAALRTGAADTVYPAVVDELSWPAPNVLLVEDLHWVDDATVDVLAYLARRLETLPAVLVLTYRDEQVPAEHPARRLLGALSGVPVARLPLRPLSAAAVDELAADSGWDPRVLHEVSGGNPFYVTEALAAPGAEVPATVADAVLARLRRLQRALPGGRRAAVGGPHPGGLRTGRGPARRPAGRADRGRGHRHPAGRPERPGVPARAGSPGRGAEPVRATPARAARGDGGRVAAGVGAPAGPARAPRHPGR